MNTCECEATFHHASLLDCERDAIVTIETQYGTYHMCQQCADELPDRYKLPKFNNRSN
jgi:hypothetical protein